MDQEGGMQGANGNVAERVREESSVSLRRSFCHGIICYCLH